MAKKKIIEEPSLEPYQEQLLVEQAYYTQLLDELKALNVRSIGDLEVKLARVNAEITSL